MLPKKVELRYCSNTWKVRVKKENLQGEEHYFFKKGWKKFCEDAQLEIFELLVFSYVDRSTFVVTVYADTALEKSIFIPPRCIVGLKDYRCYKIVRIPPLSTSVCVSSKASFFMTIFLNCSIFRRNLLWLVACSTRRTYP